MFVDVINLFVFVFIDVSVVVFVDFIIGVGVGGKININVNWFDDIIGVDICNVVVGDVFFDGKGMLDIKCGIEVGYIF